MFSNLCRFLKTVLCVFLLSAAGCSDDGTSGKKEDVRLYNVNVEACLNGSVSADPVSAAAGTQISLFNTPDPGYELECYSVKNSAGENLSVDADGRFTMPDSDVTAAGTFSAVRVKFISIAKTVSHIYYPGTNDRVKEEVNVKLKSISIERGEVYPVAAEFFPADVGNQKVRWSSADSSVAQIDDSGVITGTGTGTTTVTAVSESGGKTAQLSVSVTPARTELVFVNGEAKITAGGLYRVGKNDSGIVRIKTSAPVDIKGPSHSAHMLSANKVSNLHFDCTSQVSDITFRDIFIDKNDNTAHLADFSGKGNRLNFEEACIFDNIPTGYGSGGDTSFHVGPGTGLTVGGAGTAFIYKWSAGTAFGGANMELNGDLTFAMTGSAFVKGSKQGAVIGAGASITGSDIPGTITFESGEYNLITNSRGGCIGGSAGSTGASQGTKVYIKGGSLTVNTDWTGAAIGGGGYDSGNDSSGGTAYITGGSLRIFCDYNMASNNGESKYWRGLAPTLGVNNVVMTAERKDAQNRNLFVCYIDTTGIDPDENGDYTVRADGKLFFKGRLHSFCYCKETLDKVSQFETTDTTTNWLRSADDNLYLYLSGDSTHTIDVNGTVFTAVPVPEVVNAEPADQRECTGGAFTVTGN